MIPVMVTCIVCGCTDANACIDENGETCAWAALSSAAPGEGLCSFCAIQAALERVERGIAPLPGDAELLADALGMPAAFERDAPLVELVSDYEADLFIRDHRRKAAGA